MTISALVKNWIAVGLQLFKPSPMLTPSWLRTFPMTQANGHGASYTTNLIPIAFSRTSSNLIVRYQQVVMVIL